MHQPPDAPEAAPAYAIGKNDVFISYSRKDKVFKVGSRPTVPFATKQVQ
ncbi:MAG TPA: hypothetical protein IGS37_03015 [Synechococcales cyanobacterium M55_K2018_004]|nr:hypothetical protein [Synechococcales cyanobacterium M55_K2018_004]